MSITNIASTKNTGYDSSEVQVKESEQGKNGQSQQIENIQKAAATKSNVVEIKSSSYNNSADTEISDYGDTVEISKEGKIMAQNIAQSSKAESGDRTKGNEIDSIKASNAQLISSDDSVNTNNLSQYSEYELKQMLAKGTISRSEYASEISRRKSEADSSQDTDKYEFRP